MAEAQSKGTNMMYLKRVIKEMGKEAETKFFSTLTEEEQNIYRKTLPISWMPIKIQGILYEKGSKYLFPEDDRQIALRKIGRESMKETLNGIYRLILRFVSVNQAIEQVARTWRIYIDKGDAICERLENNKVLLMVKNIPELPDAFQETIAGTIEVILEMTGVKNSTIKYDGKTKGTHRWLISW